ncbi:MAG: methyltransferase, partial [Candidatus Riflebacteria bacterium]|nr:methyltransferase [Candidatus Riflebacteria bacterium]
MEIDARPFVTPLGVLAERGPSALLSDDSTRFLMTHLTVQPGARAAEPGCGTGMLSLFLALAGASRVVGTDVDETALAAARENARANRIGGVEFCTGSLLEPVDGPLDLVVAQLPHRPAPRPVDRRFFGGEDGTDLVIATIRQAGDRLVPAGLIYLYLNSIANPARVLAELTACFDVQVCGERRRPFSPEEMDRLTPGE